MCVWLGTCDLTAKNKQYISLRTETDEIINKLTDKYSEIINIVKKYPGSRVTILETPTYSIKKWNKQKGHKDSSLFEEQNEKLAEQIHNLNSRGREINNVNQTHSPEFSSDLSTSRKYCCGKERKVKTKKYYNFGLYKDRIHPDNTLAKAWLRKISEQAKLDCWTDY